MNMIEVFYILLLYKNLNVLFHLYIIHKYDYIW